MHFVRADAAQGVEELRSRLLQRLVEGRRVLWLVPGGSNIPYAVQVMNELPDDLTKQLSVLLTDERYGPPGHRDSNFQHLLDAGFAPKHAAWLPILAGKTLAETAQDFDRLAGEQFRRAECIVGQFGIGADGHIAGIVPHSPATAAIAELATGYAAIDGFTRLTLTFPALREVSVAFVFAYGASKHETLRRLRDERASLDTQPAQILKVIPETYLYNDQVAEEG